MSSTNHGKGFGRIEKRHPRVRSQELTSGIDEVDIFLARLGHRAVAQHAGLAVIDNRSTFRNELGAQGRNPDSQVDDVSVLKLSGDPHCDNLPI